MDVDAVEAPSVVQDLPGGLDVPRCHLRAGGGVVTGAVTEEPHQGERFGASWSGDLVALAHLEAVFIGGVGVHNELIRPRRGPANAVRPDLEGPDGVIGGPAHTNLGRSEDLHRLAFGGDGDHVEFNDRPNGSRHPVHRPHLIEEVGVNQRPALPPIAEGHLGAHRQVDALEDVLGEVVERGAEPRGGHQHAHGEAHTDDYGQRGQHEPDACPGDALEGIAN